MNTQLASPTGLAVADDKIKHILSLKKITPNDIGHLTKLECQYLSEIATHSLNRLKGKERDTYIEKIEQVMDADTKNALWENNHATITATMANLMRQYGTMPTRNQIAEATGLTRQTVSKHIKHYRAHPGFADEMEQFKLLSNNVLAKVFKFASNGDMRAARLYFEMVGAINKRPTGAVVNQQNNYIQINNTILSQENLDRLSAEQLAQIERIVRG